MDVAQRAFRRAAQSIAGRNQEIVAAPAPQSETKQPFSATAHAHQAAIDAGAAEIATATHRLLFDKLSNMP